MKNYKLLYEKQKELIVRLNKLSEYLHKSLEYGEDADLEEVVDVKLSVIHKLESELTDIESKEITPLTDEMIEEWVKEHGYYGHCTSEWHEGLEEGAKWMRDKLTTK